MNKTRRTLLAASALLALAPLAQAQGYPNKPIKIIYTYAPGGTGDVIARTLADGLSRLLGQPVVVDNRTGGSGAVGTLAAARAPGDGYTLLVTTITTVVQVPLVTKDASFDPVKGLTPIVNLAMTPLVLLAHKDVPANDYESFVAWAKKQPKGVDVAVAGPTLEVATALLNKGAKLNLVNVAYRGGGPALQGVLSGDTKVIFQPPSVTMNEFIKDGRLKVLGVTSAQPSPAVPGGVPISKFVPGYVQDINFALWSAPGTPPDVVARLAEATRKTLAEPGMTEKFIGFGVPLAVAGADEVVRITQREAQNIKTVMETTAVKFGE
jgi:tripartite-type tricarboxylate transporter receptor subunit TctC